ncbi:hypothetical protein ACMD2_17202 [Ananas comosus]|uniref:Uncharacterized protein n=1 Tax=Ananas comosus TaxID=4615 RepID=A0A199VLD7_ANACO|nr:hypothetical protein ACMD2_17202 [Ananas comosus]
MEAEEKEQLSPVAVMDFPYENEDEDEDEDATTTTTSPSSPSFQQTLANIEIRYDLLSWLWGARKFHYCFRFLRGR